MDTETYIPYSAILTNDFSFKALPGEPVVQEKILEIREGDIVHVRLRDLKFQIPPETFRPKANRRGKIPLFQKPPAIKSLKNISVPLEIVGDTTKPNDNFIIPHDFTVTDKKGTKYPILLEYDYHGMGKHLEHPNCDVHDHPEKVYLGMGQSYLKNFDEFLKQKYGLRKLNLRSIRAYKKSAEGHNHLNEGLLNLFASESGSILLQFLESNDKIAPDSHSFLGSLKQTILIENLEVYEVCNLLGIDTKSSSRVSLACATIHPDEKVGYSNIYWLR